MSDYALKFYSFVADNYAPFYSTPIECTDRDAAYVWHTPAMCLRANGSIWAVNGSTFMRSAYIE